MFGRWSRREGRCRLASWMHRYSKNMCLSKIKFSENTSMFSGQISIVCRRVFCIGATAGRELMRLSRLRVRIGLGKPLVLLGADSVEGTLKKVGGSHCWRRFVLDHSDGMAE